MSTTTTTRRRRTTAIPRRRSRPRCLPTPSAQSASAAATSSMRSSSASRPSRASATPSIPRTTTPAGTSPARRACSARRRPLAGCSALSTQQMIWAIGLAATQAAGLREMFGSMGKAFHPGRSAQNGYAAALLAREGFTAGEHGIEGPRGFAAVQAADATTCRRSPTGLGDRLGSARQHLQALPVRHRQPSDDRRLHSAARRASHRPRTRSRRVRLRVAPLVIDLCNQQNITERAAGEVLRLSRRGRRSGARQGGACRNTPTRR